MSRRLHHFILGLLGFFALASTPLQADKIAFSVATYQVTFAGNWNADTHPMYFPESAHFSPNCRGHA